MNLHRVFGTTPGKGMQPKEVIAYSVAGFGQNMICAMVASYIMLFYTDAVGLLPGGVALLMLGNRLFDACNDPIMGSIVDRTRTRWGKLRPYLLFTPIPIGIITVFCFTTFPEAGYTFKFTYATITYVLWGILYTILDVPYWGLSTAMTSDTHKRSIMLSVARIVCTAGYGVVTLAVPIIIGSIQRRVTGGLALEQIPLELQEEMRMAIAAALRPGFFWMAVVIAVVATPLIFVGFKGTVERYYEDTPPLSLGQNLLLIFKNKPLMQIVLAGILGSLKTVFLTGGVYFAKYCLGNSDYYTIITLTAVPGGLGASILLPWLAKRYGKRNVFIYSHILGGVVLLAMYFIGWKTQFGLIFNLVGLILVGIPLGLYNILTYAMIADTVDYLEWKEGIRAEGICFSMQTLISKIGMAGCSFAIMITLSIVGYVENVAQPVLVQDGIYFSSVALAAISMLASIIPIIFYKFTEEEQARVVAITNARKGIDFEGNLADTETEVS